MSATSYPGEAPDPRPAPGSGPRPEDLSRFQRPRDLHLVSRQLRFEQLAFWRNPLGAIFTVGFSLIFVVLLGTEAGHSRVSYLGNIRLVQYYVEGFVAYGIMAACFNMLAINLVNRRETGLLKRVRLSPLPAWALVTAVLLSTAIICVIQVVLLLVVGRLAFQVQLPVNVGAFVVTLLVGALSFSAMGVGISTVIPNQDAAGPITSVVFFVLLFLSGLWFPLHSSSGLAQFSGVFPVRHFILAIQASFGTPPAASVWAWNDLGVVAVWGIVGCLVAARRFSWSPHR